MKQIYIFFSILILFSVSSYASDKPLTHDERFYREIANLGIDSISSLAKKSILAGKEDDAISYYSIGIARYSPDCSKKEKITFIGMMNNLGYLHFFHNNDPIQSYNYLIRALKIAEDIGDTTSLPEIHLNLANVYCTLDDYDSAIDNFKKSFHYSLKEKNFEMTLSSLIGLANLTYSSGKDSLEKINDEIVAFNSASIPTSTPLLDYTRLMIKGLKEADNGNYDSALTHLNSAEQKINSPLTPDRYRYVLMSLRASVYLEAGQYQKCESELKSILQHNNEADIRAASYYQLWKCYQKTGQTDSVARYTSLYLTLSDTMLHSGQLKVLRDIEAQTDLERYNHEMTTMTNRNRSLMTYGGIISGMLIILLLLGWWLWKSRQQLIKSNEELYKRLQKEIHTDTPRFPTLATQPVPETPAEGEPVENSPLMKSLLEIMSTSSEIYNQNFSIENLASLADAPVRKVSQTINNELGLNFSTFLQRYRIEEACRRLDDAENYGDYTIEAISESVGFKSRGNFVQIFKKITGMTPSTYQKISRSQ